VQEKLKQLPLKELDAYLEDCVLITFSMQYNTEYGESLRIAGDNPYFGCWDISQAQIMNKTNGLWTLEVKLHELDIPLQYKYLVWNETLGRELWEPNSNRIIEEKRCFSLNDSWGMK